MGKKARKLRCVHCGYSWSYRGKSKYYATCPQCMGKTPVRRKKS